VVTGVPILTPAKLAVEIIEKIVKAKILAKWCIAVVPINKYTFNL